MDLPVNMVISHSYVKVDAQLQLEDHQRDEQFEQILQPLSVTNSDLQMGRIQGKK